jgi:hypothetical protein
LFEGLQILFTIGLGIVLFIKGIVKLLSKGINRHQGWLLIIAAFSIQSWWIFLVIDEAARTVTDSEGTYIIPRGE